MALHCGTRLYPGDLQMKTGKQLSLSSDYIFGRYPTLSKNCNVLKVGARTIQTQLTMFSSSTHIYPMHELFPFLSHMKCVRGPFVIVFLLVVKHANYWRQQGGDKDRSVN
jgi:hypothetical protein